MSELKTLLELPVVIGYDEDGNVEYVALDFAKMDDDIDDITDHISEDTEEQARMAVVDEFERQADMAIAMEEEVFNEVRFGIMDTCRGLKRYMDSKRKAYRKKQRMDSLLKYAPETSKAISKLSGRDTDKVKNLFIKIIEKKYA